MTQKIVPPPLSDVVRFRNQDFEKIRQSCSEHDILFEDCKFNPEIGSLTWKRPWEINTSACFFQDGTKTYEVRQGLLNDGHLAVAMQALTSRPELLQWVIPPEQQCSKNNCGVVHFRVWQHGTWYDICVDDRLPTDGDALVYTHSYNDKEFWCALLEKAYAKLHGSYEALQEGHCADAMVDLSGGISELVLLDRPQPEIGVLLSNAYDMNLLMCCSISKEYRTSRGSVNIVEVAHYCITAIKRELTSDKVLVKLRSPRTLHDLINVRSSQPTLKSKHVHFSVSDTECEVDNERECWISESDFVNTMSTLSICHFSPDTVMNIDHNLGSSDTWFLNSFKGEWVRGLSAGGKGLEAIHKNHQYRITLHAEDEKDDPWAYSVVVSLMQKFKTRQQQWNLGFKLFRLENVRSLPSHLGYEFFVNNPHNFGVRSHANTRELVHRQRLLPGVYCILPCTKNSNEEGKFMLRIYTRVKTSMEENSRRVSVGQARRIVSEMVLQKFMPVEEETNTDEEVVKMFSSVSDRHMTVDWRGLKWILDSHNDDTYNRSQVVKVFHAAYERVSSLFGLNPSNPPSSNSSQSVFSKELCRNLITLSTEDDSGKIGFNEYDHLWSQICQWKLSFSLHSKRKGVLEAQHLCDALEKVGFFLGKDVLGRLIHKFADENGHLEFDDFVMLIVTLKLHIKNFEGTEKAQNGQTVVTLNEWIRRSITT